MVKGNNLIDNLKNFDLAIQQYQGNKPQLSELLKKKKDSIILKALKIMQKSILDYCSDKEYEIKFKTYERLVKNNYITEDILNE